MEVMAMEENFWKNKKIFLTGHTGFKGGWMSLWLQSLGAKVTGYSLEPSSNPNFFQVGNVAEEMTSIIGDISDYKSLSDAIKISEPEIIFHMAAQPLVRYSYENTIETYTTNVMGTVNLLEASRGCKSIKAIVNITTDKCYENKEWVWSYRENEPMGGHDPYSSSKGCAELVTSSFRSSFFNKETYHKHGVALASVRAGNVIGGGDWAEDRLIPDIFRSIESGKSIKVRNPKSIRPWQHVLEPLAGYLMLAQNLYNNGTKYAEAWNFGPNTGEAISVQEIIEDLNTLLLPAGINWDIDLDKNYHEANLLTLDISKANKFLKWKPLLNMKDALELIVDWHKGYKNNENMKIFSLKQIKEYQGKL